MKNGCLEPSDHGRRFSANIAKIQVEGKISFSNGRYHLCQNEVPGNNGGNKLGYKYSYVPASSNINNWIFVTNFKFIGMTKNEIENYKDFKKGDVVVNQIGTECVIVEELGTVVFCHRKTSPHKEINLYGKEELYLKGYRLDVKPEEEEKPVVELSVAEIAKKLGLSPEQLKVVDKM